MDSIFRKNTISLATDLFKGNIRNKGNVHTVNGNMWKSVVKSDNIYDVGFKKQTYTTNLVNVFENTWNSLGFHSL